MHHHLWLLLLGVSLHAAPQSQTSKPAGKPPEHAVFHADGPERIVIQTDSSRPLSQAITALRRQYGLVIDYEESRFQGNEVIVDADGRMRPAGGSVWATVRDPDSVGSDKITVVRELADQFASASRSTRVDSPSRGRYSVGSYVRGESLLLDSPITMKLLPRTLEQTIALICEKAAESQGSKCERVGLADAELANTIVESGADSPVSARVLLARALDSAAHRKVWVLTFEPEENKFLLGIQPAVHVSGPLGGVQAIPRLSSDLRSTPARE